MKQLSRGLYSGTSINGHPNSEHLPNNGQDPALTIILVPIATIQNQPPISRHLSTLKNKQLCILQLTTVYTSLQRLV